MYIFFWYLFASYMLNIIVLRMLIREDNIQDSEKNQAAWLLFKLWMTSPITIFITSFVLIACCIDRFITNNRDGILWIKNVLYRFLRVIFGL